MNRIVSLLCFSLASLFGGCGASPTSQDVVGIWVNPDGGELTLEANGEFFARALPQGVFWRRDEPGAFDGKGTWKLHKGSPYWEVKLGFAEISGRAASWELSALVSGSGSSTYLYQWVSEEGGARYKLERKEKAKR